MQERGEQREIIDEVHPGIYIYITWETEARRNQSLQSQPGLLSKGMGERQEEK